MRPSERAMPRVPTMAMGTSTSSSSVVTSSTSRRARSTGAVWSDTGAQDTT